IGGRLLKPIKYTLPIASAQLKSSLILAAMYADGESVIIEPVITRDHTERMMTAFGCNISVDDSSRSIKIQGGYQHIGTRIDIPGDISSAAFFMVAAAICPGSEINLLNIGINPTRIGVINILKEMGADIKITNRQDELCEPTANIRVRYSSLKGIEIPENQVSLAIDEFPIIFVAAACATGDTILRGAEELKVKESDRIESMAKGLKILGIETDVFDDGIKIIGGKIGSGTVNSNHDHRIAMAFSVAGLRSSGAITIQNCKNIATSFPNFVDIARSVGMKIDLESN
ncbi:MAG: bifunctional prephenate dehydrogenase/3-phosphoshikimate 1-carboxyvinyltransferase, partial [Pseudomonadota bacterium]|nr:bifunctional prephenate dehydrogenase/3-phosphoshikimate 1-carboxyvinyltransferase [Pseudomonadota bacterium]